MKPNKGRLKLAEYYADLRALWQERDFYEDFQANCGFDAQEYKSKVDKFSVLNFCLS